MSMQTPTGEWLGRAPQYDARNRSLYELLSPTDRDHALTINDYTYMRRGFEQVFQGRTPLIVTTAFANALHLLNVTIVDGEMLGAVHRMARAIFAQMGGDPLAGVSLLSVALALRDFGIIDSFAWEYDVAGIMSWMTLGRGPVIIGCTLFADMLMRDRQYGIRVGGSKIGGAAFTLYRCNREAQMFWCLTSWQSIKRFSIRATDLEYLLSRSDGEAVAITGWTKVQATATELILARGRSYSTRGGKYIALQVYSTDENDMKVLVAAFGGNYYDHEEGWQWVLGKRTRLVDVCDAVAPKTTHENYKRLSALFTLRERKFPPYVAVSI